MTDCPFCGRIERGEFDYSDDYNVAFQPLNPVTPGHFLVVPRTHVSHALEAPPYAGRALKFAGYLANQMDLTDVNFVTSAGKAATQTVFHLHIHIVPRREGDGLVLPWTGQAERQQIDPRKLDLLADWMDTDDAAHGRTSPPEVQADLRQWAKLLRGGGHADR